MAQAMLLAGAELAFSAPAPQVVRRSPRRLKQTKQASAVKPDTASEAQQVQDAASQLLQGQAKAPVLESEPEAAGLAVVPTDADGDMQEQEWDIMAVSAVPPRLYYRQKAF